MPEEEPKIDTRIEKALELCPDAATGDRFRRVAEGEFEGERFDCSRTALYIFGFIKSPLDEIPFWSETQRRLVQLDAPEPWALAIYKEQMVNHSGIVTETEPNIIVFSKHGEGGKPIFESEATILEYYPSPLYFRVLSENAQKSD